MSLMETLKRLLHRHDRESTEDKDAALKREASQDKRLEWMQDAVRKETEFYRLQQGVKKSK